MQTKTDAQLLREYAGTGSESAFGELVSRHADLVYSAALRQVIDPDFARDVAQSVFADLARKAKSLSDNIVLAGWLYRSTRFAALTFLRNERRRQNRERQAMQFLDPPGESSLDWDRIRPVLDEAMANLGDADRDALVLRFFKNEDLRAVGVALGTSEDAAQKRVTRAVEKLRAFLLRRGVTLSSAALASALTGSAVQAAPAALAGTISAAAVAGAAAAVAGSTFNLLNLMSMTKLKAGLFSAAIVVGAGTPIVVQQQSVSRLRAENRELREQSQQLEQFRSENQQAAGLRVGAEELSRLREEVAEIHRLRADVARLRREKEDAARLQAENTRLKENLNAFAATEPKTQAAVTNSCETNLRILEGAKDQWALEDRLGLGSNVTGEQISPYLKGGFENYRCPSGGEYTISRIGEVSSCTIHGSLPSSLTPEQKAVRTKWVDRLKSAHQLILAFHSVAEEHGGVFPANLAQLLADPDAFNVEGLSPDQFEVVYPGKLSDLKEPKNVIVIREKQPSPDPAGNLTKIYGFADGHMEIHTTRSKDFQKWEKERMVRNAAQ